jgi:hypothetical protein
VVEGEGDARWSADGVAVDYLWGEVEGLFGVGVDCLDVLDGGGYRWGAC